MINSRTLVAMLTAVALLAPATLGAAAQDMQMQQEAPAAEDFSDEQVTLFAEAYVQIQQIGQQYQAPIESAETEEERQSLAQQANNEMLTVIDDMEGLSLDAYNGIAGIMQSNPDFAEQVQSEINSMTSDMQ